MKPAPEVSIHIIGEEHHKTGIAYLPKFLTQAQTFFFPRGTNRNPGRNILIEEASNLDEEYRNQLVILSKKYSPLEAHVRASSFRAKDRFSPGDFDKAVSVKVAETRQVGMQENNYDAQKWNTLEELHQGATFQLDTEYHSLEEIEAIAILKDRGSTDFNTAAKALYFGEFDLAADKCTVVLLAEAQLTRERHQLMTSIVGLYLEEAHSTGIPLRVLVSFGDGHVRGLQRRFEQALGGLTPKPRVTSSYADEAFYSHYYDLMYEMEADPERRPSKREVLNILIQNVFEESSFCRNHPLRKSLTPASLSEKIYPLIRNFSDEELSRLIDIMVNRGYEQGLNQLIGSAIKPQNVLSKILRPSAKRVGKLLMLRK